MKISFPERRISKGPLEVLRHLYYYTGQYGLSVRQFTGESSKYWERLPGRLEEVKDNRAKLNKIIRELKALAEEAPVRLKKRRAQVGRLDEEKKIILDARKKLKKSGKKPEELIEVIEGLETVVDTLYKDKQAQGIGPSEENKIILDVRRVAPQSKEKPAKLASGVKELQALADALLEEVERRRSEIAGKWAEKEVVLNAQLVSVLAALPGELLSAVFGRLTAPDNSPRAYRVVDLHFVKEEGEGASFVEPDLLLLGDDQLLMVEMKTRGGAKSSRSYPPRQLLNYMKLVAECQDSESGGLPTKFSHLILVPTTDLKWLERHGEWVENPAWKDGGRIRVKPNACLRFGKRYSKENPEHMKSLLKETPIYYHSWEQLANAYKSAVGKYGDVNSRAHWERIGSELEYLARRAGKYA